jgi:hypothetical protein
VANHSSVPVPARAPSPPILLTRHAERLTDGRQDVSPVGVERANSSVRAAKCPAGYRLIDSSPESHCNPR